MTADGNATSGASDEPGSAVAAAAILHPGDAVDWRALETAAYARLPAMADRIDMLHEYHAKRKPVPRIIVFPGKVAFVAMIIVLAIVVWFSPIIGFVILLGNRYGGEPLDPFVVIPWSATTFAFAFVMLVTRFAGWWRGGKHTDGLGESQAGTALVLGAFTVALIAARGQTAGVAGWPVAALVVAVCAAAGGVFLVLTLRARAADSRRANLARLKGEPVEKDPLPTEPVKPIAKELRSVSAADQAAVRADIDAAINDLEARGVVTSEDAATARQASLGALALRMYRLALRNESERGSGSAAEGTR